MKVKSLGCRTDLIFASFDGEICDRGDYLVIRSPTNPTFYWGNYLLFSRPPQEGDISRWQDLFATEIGVPPEVQHQVFGWDSPDGNEGVIHPFLEAGFRPDYSVVLTSSRLQPPARPAGSVSIRTLKTTAAWQKAVENQVVCREPEFEEEGFRQFRSRQMERHRNMVKAGLGDWYGAFEGERLIADLGIFHDQDLGRYQSVQTHPDFRRRGIAGTLIYHAGRQAINQYDLQTLVIVAKADSSPARLYETLGFRPTERLVGLELWPDMDNA